MEQPELLMPAGDMDKLRFALAFGADAVYLGIPRFSLRSRENGFKSFEDVAAGVLYAQGIGKKAYVTANIFPHNHKVHSFTRYVAQLLSLCRPDAWIMSDPGLIMLMKENFPEETIHISVQANTMNFAAARFWRDYGAKRIIVSREIGIKEIKEIHEACPDMELECFVHGAICMAYSGRCLISNYLSNRDGNQGACTNSCRWEYKVFQKKDAAGSCCGGASGSVSAEHSQPELSGEFFVKEKERPEEFFELDEDEHGSYLMNSRDLCAINSLAELRDAGVCSFKVEGRSKSVYYAAMIARAYRRAIDGLIAGRSFDPEHARDIFATSNRGFITGFLHGNPGQDGQEYRFGSSEYSAYRFSGVVRAYDKDKRLALVEARNPLRKGLSYELCLPSGDETIEITAIFDQRLQAVDVSHGGSARCWIACENDPGPFAIIREKIKEFSGEQVVIGT